MTSATATAITVRLSHCGGDQPDIIWRPRAATLERVKAALIENWDRRVIDPATGLTEPQSDAPLNWGEIVALFCETKFGSGAFFLHDHGLPGGYGQIFQPLPSRLGGGNSAKTGRVYIEVTGL